MTAVLGPETERIIDELAARRRAERARKRRLLDLSLTAVFEIALDFFGADALLHGKPVPKHHLDPPLTDYLQIPEGGSLVLDLDTVEQIILAGTAPPREHICSRCREREAA